MNQNTSLKKSRLYFSIPNIHTFLDTFDITMNIHTGTEIDSHYNYYLLIEVCRIDNF